MTENTTTKTAKPMSTKAIIEQLGSLKAHCASLARDADIDHDHQIWRYDVAALEAALEILHALDDATVSNAKMAKAAMDQLKAQGQEVSRLRVLHRGMCRKYAEGTPPDLQSKRLGAAVYLCPECHKRIGKNHTHCHHCGKKILWPYTKRGAGHG